MNGIFKGYLTSLPIGKRKKGNKIKVIVANNVRAISRMFPNVMDDDLKLAVKWLKKNKLHIPFCVGKVKELVRD